MTYTWKRTSWKKGDIEESIPLGKITEDEVKADVGKAQRVVYIGWKYKKCFHYILSGGYVHVARSSIKYCFKGE